MSLLLFLYILFPCSLSRYIIATSHFPPMCECNIGETGQDFKGIDMDYFRLIAKKLNWVEWNFYCIDFTELKTILSHPDEIFAFAGGLTISEEYTEKGFKFSLPTMNSGLTILTKKTTDDWTFIKVLTIEIVLMIIGTNILVGILIFFLERKVEGLDNYLWHTMASFFFISQVKINKTSSRLIMIAFWYMSLIILASYNAYLTSVVTVEKLLGGINTPEDLSMKDVKTFSIYASVLYNYGANPVLSTKGYSSSNAQLDVIPFEMVENDLSRTDEYKIDAFVFDDPAAAAAEFLYCDIYTTSRVFSTFSYGILYHSSQDDKIIQDINIVIEDLNQNRTSGSIIADFLEKEYSSKKCQKSELSDKLSVNSTKGLWIILAASAGVSMLIFIINRYLSKIQRIQDFLYNYKIIEPKEIEVKKRKVGDELVVQNLKDVTHKMMDSLNENIRMRLDEVDEKITKFYKLLLNGEKALLEYENENENVNEHEHEKNFLGPDSEEDHHILIRNGKI